MRVIAADFETALLTGEPSVEYHRPDFRATSCAFVWDGGSKVCLGECEIRKFLEIVDKHSLPLVVHNFTFEYGVMFNRFPGYEHLVQYDTARLAQVADNGGKDGLEDTPDTDTDALIDDLNGVTKS